MDIRIQRLAAVDGSLRSNVLRLLLAATALALVNRLERTDGLFYPGGAALADQRSDRL